MSIFPRVSIVILSFNRCKELRNSLDHIKLIDYPDIEVVVFDNGSKDGTSEMVRSHQVPVNLICSETNTGIAGYNKAVNASTGKIIIILDDDSFIAPESLKIATQILMEDEKIGILAFKILLLDGKNVTKGWKKQTISFWGCGAAIRRNVWDLVHGYDNDFFLYLNEIDMAIRVWNHGYRVIYDDRCVAYHMVAGKNRASKRLIFFSTRNVVWFHLKHIPSKYLIRTLTADLLSYFNLSLLGKCPVAWFRGLTSGIRTCHIALQKRETVKVEVVRFYLANAFMWQWPYRQLILKVRSGEIRTRASGI